MAKDMSLANVRLTADELAAIKKAAQERGMTQVEFLRQAALGALLDDSAEAVPDLKSETERFRAMVDEITSCFKAALDRAANAEAHAASRVHDQLTTLTTVAQENLDLRQKMEDLRAELSELRQKLKEADAKAANADGLRVELNSLRVENNALTARTLEAEAASLAAQKHFADDLARVRNEEFERIKEFLKTLQGTRG